MPFSCHYLISSKIISTPVNHYYRFFRPLPPFLGIKVVAGKSNPIPVNCTKIIVCCLTIDNTILPLIGGAGFNALVKSYFTALLPSAKTWVE